MSNWMTYLSAGLRIAKGILPLVEAEFPALKATAVAGAGLALAGATADAVAAKASPASLKATAVAVMATANAAGLSAQDQSTVGAVGATLDAYAPVASAMIDAGFPEHAAVVNEAMAALQAVAQGVQPNLAS